ncbi:MAG: RluA family pseudouridine synthase [Planctomycetaceae bacterium]
MTLAYPFTAELIVEHYLNGVRIDSFLSKHLRNYTPWRIARIVRAGAVRIDDVTVDLNDRVRTGQRIDIRLIEPPDKLVKPVPFDLPVLYEDPWLIVIDKPPGVIVHPAGEFQTHSLVNALQSHLDAQSAWPGLLRAGIVHRLDRLTSGVIVVTKEHLSHRLLSIQFQQSRISKCYLALVEGVVEQDRQTVNLPIGRAPGGRGLLMSAKPDAIEARSAKTIVEVVERFADHTLVRAKPLSGRLHQIRVHLAEIGYPVIADSCYAAFGRIKPPPFRANLSADRKPWLYGTISADEELDEAEEFSEEIAEIVDEPTDAIADAMTEKLMPRHALHASQLAFQHPILDEWFTFTAPLPEDMQRALDRLRG